MCGLFHVTCVWFYSIVIFIYAILYLLYFDWPRTGRVISQHIMLLRCSLETDKRHFWRRKQWKVNTKVQILSMIVFHRNILCVEVSHDSRKVQFLHWLALDGEHHTNCLICLGSTVWLSQGLLTSSSHRKCVSRTQDGPNFFVVIGREKLKLFKNTKSREIRNAK